MAYLENSFKGNIWTGFAIGIGAAVLAPAIIPVLAGIVKPVAKSALKSWMVLREKGAQAIAAKRRTVFAIPVQQAGTAGKLKLKTFTGRVVQVDTQARTVTVAKKIKGKDIAILTNLDEKATLRMGRRKKELADIKIGDKVAAKYNEIGSSALAHSLALMPEQKTAPKPKETQSP